MGDKIYEFIDSIVKGNVRRNKDNFKIYGNPYTKATQSKKSLFKYFLLNFTILLIVVNGFIFIPDIIKGQFSLSTFLFLQICFVPLAIFVTIPLVVFFLAMYKVYSISENK